MTIRVKLNQVAVLHAIARRNMSPNMLAIRTGISSGYISQIMCGTRNPSPAVRQKLQDILQPFNLRRHSLLLRKTREMTFILDKRRKGFRALAHMIAAAYRRRNDQ